MVIKVIIAGGRDFSDYNLLRDSMDKILSNINPEWTIKIISGCCKGADKLGEKYAFDRHHNVIYFPADWQAHGNSAGPIRNREMAQNATHCVVFWDGKSTGTKSMINEAHAAGLAVRIIPYK